MDIFVEWVWEVIIKPLLTSFEHKTSGIKHHVTFVPFLGLLERCVPLKEDLFSGLKENLLKYLWFMLFSKVMLELFS